MFLILRVPFSHSVQISLAEEQSARERRSVAFSPLFVSYLASDLNMGSRRKTTRHYVDRNV